MLKHREIKLPIIFKSLLLQNALMILLVAFGNEERLRKNMSKTNGSIIELVLRSSARSHHS